MSNDGKGAGGAAVVGVGVLAAALRMCSHDFAPQVSRALSHQPAAEVRIARALEKSAEETALPFLSRSAEPSGWVIPKPSEPRRTPSEPFWLTEAEKKSAPEEVADELVKQAAEKLMDSWLKPDGGPTDPSSKKPR